LRAAEKREEAFATGALTIPTKSQTKTDESKRRNEMEKLWRYTPWFTRLILVPPALIFAMLAWRHIVHPVESASAIGIAFTSALGITITRVGLGGFPLACSLFTLYCLLSRRISTGLTFVATLLCVLLIVRVFGMTIDGTVQENMRLVCAETILLVFFVIGIFLDTAKRRRELKPAV
jgi:hypothetical protein